MFTIKLYTENGSRQKILEAESFTILRGSASEGDEAEITLHQKNGDGVRYDIRPQQRDGYEGPPCSSALLSRTLRARRPR